MTGNLYLAKKMLNDHPDAQRKLEHIEQLTLRAADMIQQLLTFARRDRVSMRPIRLVPFVKEVLAFLRSSLPENIELKQQICADALSVIGDETQLHQVLMNLINNARDAVEHAAHPSITVRLDIEHLDQAMAARFPSARPGDYAHLTVTDNGDGIPADQIEHLFEPFFTTKEQGKGTGLGLSMVFGAVKTHQGFMDVESSPGSGATFHVYLPLQQAAADATDDQPHRALAGRGELILLVDDEQSVRQTTAEVLETLGYRVLQAENGPHGVELFGERRDEIDLVITDVVMPHGGGMLLSKHIRQLRPDMPVIFMTGYDRQDVLDEGIERSAVVSKPVQFEDFSYTIRQLLA